MSTVRKQNTMLQLGIKSIIGNVEIIERKGWGHPDKLADDLAEELSRSYSRFTLKECGIVLHHNFDKLCILGGSSKVSYGSFEMINPIRILVNGRATTKFAGKDLDIEGLINKGCREFFKDRLPILDSTKDISIVLNLSKASSPGQVYSLNSDKTRHHWFEPRGVEDLPEHKNLYSNDTSLGTGYAPLSRVENMVIKLSDYLSFRPREGAPSWLGTDVKVMAYAYGDNVDLTLCVPQISKYVGSREDYISNIKWLRGNILDFLTKIDSKLKITLNINARDNLEKDEIYLTATGSSIESGDEGVVGRGNRVNGLITPKRPMNLEGANGKNPVYHVGKIYNILASNIAEAIYKATDSPVVVDLISKTGNSLKEPWKILIQLENMEVDQEQVYKIIEEHLNKIPELTNKIIVSSTKNLRLC